MYIYNICINPKMDHIFLNKQSNRTRSQYDGTPPPLLFMGRTYHTQTPMLAPHAYYNHTSIQYNPSIDYGYHMVPLVAKTSAKKTTHSVINAYTSSLRFGGNESKAHRKANALAEVRETLKDNANWHYVFNYMFKAFSSLNLWDDFWRFTFYWFDKNSRDDVDYFEMESNSGQHDIKLKQNDKPKTIEQLNQDYSRLYWIDTTITLPIIEYELSYKQILQFLIFSTYSLLYIFLILFYIDVKICFDNVFQPTEEERRLVFGLPNSNVTTTDSKAALEKFQQNQAHKYSCMIIQEDQCRFKFNNLNYSLFDYAQIRLTLFSISLIPHILLFLYMQSQLTKIFHQLNPFTHTLQEEENGIEELNVVDTKNMKRIFLGFFTLVFFGTGGCALGLDGILIDTFNKRNSDANEKLKCDLKWGVVQRDRDAIMYPMVLMIFNAVSVAWGILYFSAKLSYFRKNKISKKSVKINRNHVRERVQNKKMEEAQKLVTQSKDDNGEEDEKGAE